MKILINVNEEAELYNSFDKDGKTLSDGIISYITNKSALLSIKDNIEIEIYSEENIDENKFKIAFDNYTKEQFRILQLETKLNGTKQLWMWIIGVIFIALSISLSMHFDALILQIISTIGSFALWEATGSWLLQSKALSLKKIRLKRLAKSQIIFKQAIT